MGTHLPDSALALQPNAGWIKRERYGDANIVFQNDLSLAHLDPGKREQLALDSCSSLKMDFGSNNCGLL
jgi:hypothetical protein